MMGRQQNQQSKLFYTRLNLDRRIRKDHILRQINRHIDFDFVYNEVKDAYGQRGNVSVPPPVILKMMLLLILYDVRSERELMSTVPERLDWLWFLGYDLDDEVPNHSVLSKARARWGVQAFQSFFDRIVLQCVQSGLISGKKLFMDSSDIQADASNNSVVNTEDIKRYLKKSYRQLEKRLDDDSNDSNDNDLTPPKSGAANKKFISTTDPDASVQRKGAGRSKLQYKVHRGVDEQHEIITATTVSSASVNEAHLMAPLLKEHERTTGIKAETALLTASMAPLTITLLATILKSKATLPLLKKRIAALVGAKEFSPKKILSTSRKPTHLSAPTAKNLHAEILIRGGSIGNTRLPRKHVNSAFCVNIAHAASQADRLNATSGKTNWMSCSSSANPNKRGKIFISVNT